MNTQKDQDKKQEIKIGDLVTDKITGFEGIVTSITTFLAGCSRVGVKSRKLVDGRPLPTELLDINDLKKVGRGVRSRKHKEKIKLGDKVEETVSGFQGIAYCITEDLNGSAMVGVIPRTTDKNKRPEVEGIPEELLRKVKDQELDQPKDTSPGGDQKVPWIR